VLAVDELARAAPGAVGTVGRLDVVPGSTNSIPGHVTASLDVRAPSRAAVDAIVEALRARFPGAAVHAESRSDGATFDADLRQRLHAAAAARGIPAGDLPSYAGHDAGILAAHVPAAMVFVRNPTGVSHAPAESAAVEDCLAATQVLADTLDGLVSAPRAAGA
jgi:N-carbamoyl-L-amino-acid hydrolase